MTTGRVQAPNDACICGMIANTIFKEAFLDNGESGKKTPSVACIYGMVSHTISKEAFFDNGESGRKSRAMPASIEKSLR